MVSIFGREFKILGSRRVAVAKPREEPPIAKTSPKPHGRSDKQTLGGALQNAAFEAEKINRPFGTLNSAYVEFKKNSSDTNALRIFNEAKDNFLKEIEDIDGKEPLDIRELAEPLCEDLDLHRVSNTLCVGHVRYAINHILPAKIVSLHMSPVQAAGQNPVLGQVQHAVIPPLTQLNVAVQNGGAVAPAPMPVPPPAAAPVKMNAQEATDFVAGLKKGVAFLKADSSRFSAISERLSSQEVQDKMGLLKELADDPTINVFDDLHRDAVSYIVEMVEIANAHEDVEGNLMSLGTAMAGLKDVQKELEKKQAEFEAQIGEVENMVGALQMSANAKHSAQDFADYKKHKQNVLAKLSTLKVDVDVLLNHEAGLAAGIEKLAADYEVSAQKYQAVFGKDYQPAAGLLEVKKKLSSLPAPTRPVPTPSPAMGGAGSGAPSATLPAAAPTTETVVQFSKVEDMLAEAKQAKSGLTPVTSTKLTALESQLRGLVVSMRINGADLMANQLEEAEKELEELKKIFEGRSTLTADDFTRDSSVVFNEMEFNRA